MATRRHQAHQSGDAPGVADRPPEPAKASPNRCSIVEANDPEAAILQRSDAVQDASGELAELRLHQRHLVRRDIDHEAEAPEGPPMATQEAAELGRPHASPIARKASSVGSSLWSRRWRMARTTRRSVRSWVSVAKGGLMVSGAKTQQLARSP